MGNGHVDAPEGLPQGAHLVRQPFRRHFQPFISQGNAQAIRHGLMDLRRNAVPQLRPQ